MFWFLRNRKPKPLPPHDEQALNIWIEIVNDCRRYSRTPRYQFNEEWSQSNREMLRDTLERIRRLGKAATDRLPPEFFDEDWPAPCEPFYETVLQPAAPSPTRAVLGEPENPNELRASPPPVSSLLTAVPAVPSAVPPNPPPTLTVPAVEAMPATWPSVPTSPPAPVLSNDPATWDTGIGGPSVRLYWTASRGNPTPEYDLYRNESLYYLGLAGTTFIDNASLIGGQTYTYYVNARNGVGAKASNNISVTMPTAVSAVQPAPPPAAVPSPTLTEPAVDAIPAASPAAAAFPPAPPAKPRLKPKRTRKAAVASLPAPAAESERKHKRVAKGKADSEETVHPGRPEPPETSPSDKPVPPSAETSVEPTSVAPAATIRIRGKRSRLIDTGESVG